MNRITCTQVSWKNKSPQCTQERDVTNGQIEIGEEDQAWVSWTNKYFQIYNYSTELKLKMSIYNLIEKVDIWWQDIKKLKHIKERYVTWKNFKKYFKIKYLWEQYYEEKSKSILFNFSMVQGKRFIINNYTLTRQILTRFFKRKNFVLKKIFTYNENLCIN